MKNLGFAFDIGILLLGAAWWIDSQTSPQNQQKAMEARYIRRK